MATRTPKVPRKPKKLSFPLYYAVSEHGGGTAIYMILIDPGTVGAVIFDCELPECEGFIDRALRERPPVGIEGPWKVGSLDPVPAPGPGACYEIGGQIYCW